MSVVTTYTCDECGKDMGSGSPFTFHFPGRLGSRDPSKDVHACSERCAARQVRLVAARLDAMALARDEQEARERIRAEKAQADAEARPEDADPRTGSGVGAPPNPDPEQVDIQLRLLFKDRGWVTDWRYFPEDGALRVRVTHKTPLQARESLKQVLYAVGGVKFVFVEDRLLEEGGE